MKTFDIEVEETVQAPDIKIVVVGVGGGGGNMVTHLKKSGMGEAVTTVAINTDAQALETCEADIKLQIGEKLTHGLG